MARRLRVELTGGFYLVTARGNRGHAVFAEELDRESFLGTLAECCAKTRWRVHAYCLLADHFHLLLETPEPNLIAGMKWMLGTYTVRFNKRHGQHGHLFQGRYRSSHIGPSGGFLAQAANYIHLNPVRVREPLKTYRWSSLPAYLEPVSRPRWLAVTPVLRDCGDLTDDAPGRAQYAQRIETMRGLDSGETFKRLRNEWCFASDAYRKRLLKVLEGQEHSQASSEPALREAAESKALQLLKDELRILGATTAILTSWRKGDPRKIHIAKRLRAETTMTYRWIAEQLRMGTRGHLVHLLYWDQRNRGTLAKPAKTRRKSTQHRRVEQEADMTILTSDTSPDVSLEQLDPRFD